jgi:3-oxoacyl-[acyl-carrier-protein] synthase II
MLGERRVAITGIGVICGLGVGAEAFFANLMAGKCCAEQMPVDMGPTPMQAIAVRVHDHLNALLPKPHGVGTDRFSQFALIATQEALTDAGLDLAAIDLTRAGVYLGTAMGGSGTLDEAYVYLYQRNSDRLKPTTVLKAMNNAAAAHISMAYGFKGPTLTYSVACSSSGIAIGEAYRLIRLGLADVVVAGGSDALLTYGTLKAWQSMHTLAVEGPDGAAHACRPFSKDRSGLVLGEGAAIMVLESAEHAARRGARVYAEIAGYGASSDATHITKPSAEGQVRAMKMALQDAGMAPDEIGYINAHGTATIVGDEIETEAIKEVFGQCAYGIPVSSTKSMHGHMMGAAGAVEFLATVLAVSRHAVPPTANLGEPDPACDLDYVPHKGRFNVPVRAAMSNSFAFGGSNAVLIAKAPD